MTDWTPQDDWSQVNRGDTVRAVRAEQMLTGKVIDRLFSESTIEDNVYAIVLEVPDLADVLTIHHGYWQLSVPAKPAVELPTEPGSVIMWSRDRLLYFAYLEGSGLWDIDGTNYSERDLFGEIKDSVFILMEPVAVTAKKVLDSMKAEWEQQYTFAAAYELECKRWGVTDD